MKTMKKYIFALLAMLLPMVAQAQTAVATIGSTEYTSLPAAIAAATEGQTITLQANINTTAQIEFGKKVTLDLNGYVIEYTGTETLPSGVLMVLRGGDLTITDSRESPHSGVYSNDKAYAAVALTKAGEGTGSIPTYNGGELGAKINNLGNSTTDDPVEDAILTVEYGRLVGNYYAVMGDDTRHGTQITINGGALVGEEGSAIYNPQNGTVTINDGILLGGETAIELRSGTLVINGGTFETTSTTYSVEPNGSGTTTVGAAVAIAQHTTNMPINATINGGTFIANGEAVKLSVSNPQNNAFDNVQVKGLTTLVGESYKIPEGYNWIEYEEGISTLSTDVATVTIGTTITGYKTFAEAAAAAQPEDGLVTLYANIPADDKFTMPATAGATLKVKKNGKTLANANVAAPEGGFLMSNATAEGVTTYTVGEATFEITRANGNVSYSNSLSLLTGDGSTVKMLKDFTTTSAPNCGSSLWKNMSVTLDMNGHTLNINTSISRDYCLLVTEGCTLIVKNGTIEMAPTSASKSNGVRVEPNSKLIVEPTATINAHNGVSAVTVVGTATLETEGKLTAENSFAVAGNGSAGDGGYTINVKGGEITATGAPAIYHPNSGTLTVSDGVITGESGIYVKSGTTNITGGTITGIGAQADYEYNGNGANATGDAFVVENCGYPGGAPVVNISGGKFVSTNAEPFGTYNYGAGNDPIQHFVSGTTTFNKEIETELCAEGYASSHKLNEDGMYYLTKDINLLLTEETVTSDWTDSEQSMPLVIKDGNKTLVAGTDYQLFVLNEGATEPTHVEGDVLKKTDAGKYPFIIKGYGDNYGGEAEMTWNIIKNISKAPFVVTIDPAIYNGSGIDPTNYIKVKQVTTDGEVELVNGTDYKLTFNNTPYTDAKTYVDAITITGTNVAPNFYGGTVVTSFVVTPQDIKDAITATARIPYREQGYTVKPAVGTEGEAGYEPAVDEVTTSTGFVVTIKKNGEVLSDTDFNITVEPAAEEDDYKYTTIGTYPEVVSITPKAGNYGGVKRVALEIVPTGDSKGIADFAVVESSAIFTGQNQPPTKDNVKVYYKDPVSGDKVEMVEGTDYEIAFNSTEDSYVNAATYDNAIVVTGKGGFYGTLNAAYVIKPRDLSDEAITLNAANDIDWTGNDLTPNVNTDTNNNVVLTLTTTVNVPVDTDTTEPQQKTYKLTAADYTFTSVPSPVNDNGEYVLTFTGRGNFTGTAQLTVKVVKDVELINIEDVTLPLQILPQSGEFQLTGVEVKDGDKTLVEGTDYRLVIAKTVALPTLAAGNYSVVYTVRETGVKTGPVDVVLEDAGNFTDYLKIQGTDYYVMKSQPSTESGLKANERYLDEHVASMMAVSPITIAKFTPAEINSVEVTEQGKYKLVIMGKEEGGYTGIKVADFIVVNEYYKYYEDAAGGTVSPAKTQRVGNTANDDEPSNENPDYTEPFGIRVTASTGTATGEAVVSAGGDPDNRVTSPENKTLAITSPVSIDVDKDGTPDATITVTGIENNAFQNASQLSWLDITELDDFTAPTLNRGTQNTPFYGLAKQALVYLNGNEPKGENYVYSTIDGDYRAETFKIYDDNQGDQKGFTGEDYSWQILNKYLFTAATVTNTRQLQADHHYTTCLPYGLTLPASVKAYTLDATSEKILGFEEVTGDLEALVPYVLISEGNGQLLSTTNVEVPVITEDDELTEENPDASSKFTMKGSMSYINGTDAAGFYIMQGDNKWKQVAEGETGYDGPCVLPMRAYIVAAEGASPAKIMLAEFTNASKTTSIKRISFDGENWQDAEIYDLQGRKIENIQNVQRGVYIINGKKVVLK